MSEDDKPCIDLKFERVLCRRHGEPFRAMWPKGYPIIVLRLFECTFGQKSEEQMHKVLWAEAAKLLGLPEGSDPPDHVAAMHAVMDKKPLCCRVPVTLLESLYVESDVGVVGRCINCKQQRLGTPYRTANQGLLKHVCFNCVCTKMRATDPTVS